MEKKKIIVFFSLELNTLKQNQFEIVKTLIGVWSNNKTKLKTYQKLKRFFGMENLRFQNSKLHCIIGLYCAGRMVLLSLELAYFYEQCRLQKKKKYVVPKTFPASKYQCTRFVNCHALSLHQHIKQIQKIPSDMEAKIMKF